MHFEVQMKNDNIFISELSTSKHSFCKYHFCRGNSNKRKSRFGLIVKGRGTYMYLNQVLRVSEGNVIFIPENIYCYSEWHGNPDIEVVYLSCFMHYERFAYLPQILDVDDTIKQDMLEIAALLSQGQLETLEAYSRFYKFLQAALIKMKQSEIAFDKTLQTAITYLTDNWNKHFLISDLAKQCCVSESTLYHLFQKALGQTPVNFLNSIKINIAIEHLENSNYSIATISRMVGFNSENHFRKVFADFTGTTPLKYRKSH